jgi:hypothetical protein
MEVRFTVHALAVMAERNIAAAWVERVLEAPEWREEDSPGPPLWRAFARIPEFGDRTLRVVYHDDGIERRVITVFFDRNRRLGPGKVLP